MPAFKEAPSSAFNVAVARIAPLRMFSAATEQHLNVLADEIVTRRPWQITNGNMRAPHHWYVAHAEERGYLRQDLGYYGPGYVTAPRLLREKLLSDIAHDMRLPTTAYALAAIDPKRPDTVNASLSLIPFENAETIDEIFNRGYMIHKGPRTTGQLQKFFFWEQPHLLPAFAALSVFDIWSAIDDRHEQNVMVTLPDKDNHYAHMFGIDFESTGYMEREGVQIKNTLWQQKITSSMGVALAPIVEAAVTAIETYPASRLNQLAERLTPCSPAWQAQDEATRLHERQSLLRQALPRYFPAALTERLHHAPV